MSFRKYYFYSKIDPSQEAIGNCRAFSRKEAALHFAEVKRLPLKQFLSIFAVSR